MKYDEFITSITSEASMSLPALTKRLIELHHDVNAPRLLTGAIGLSNESGELAEIVKKIIFQGKPLDGETKFHMKRELGDIYFYWVTACLALDYEPEAVIQENINKLTARYPEGTFVVSRSEDRAEGDI